MSVLTCCFGVARQLRKLTKAGRLTQNGLLYCIPPNGAAFEASDNTKTEEAWRERSSNQTSTSAPFSRLHADVLKLAERASPSAKESGLLEMAVAVSTY